MHVFLMKGEIFIKNKRSLLICSIVLVAMVAFVGIGVGNQKIGKEEIIISGIIPAKTETEMYLDSDVIVKGTVKEILDSKWSNENFKRGEHIRNVLQTDIIVEVDELIEGNIVGDEVTVRIDKGEDENTIVRSEGYPDFTIGEKVVLFLARDDSDIATNDDYYVLTGMKQGKYTLKENGNINRLSENDVYFNEQGEINPQDMKDKLKELKEKNPNYRAEKQEQQKKIIEKNKELFGQ